MRLSKVGDTIGRGIYWTAGKMAWLAGGVLLFLMCFMFSDVFGRYLLNKPILGSVDVGEVMLVLLAFFGVAYTQMERGHVGVELVVSKVSHFTRAILNTISLFLSFGIFALIGWQLGARAVDIMISPDPDPVSLILDIPHAPFMLLAAIGLLMLCLVLLVDFFHSLGQMITGDKETSG